MVKFGVSPLPRLAATSEGVEQAKNITKDDNLNLFITEIEFHKPCVLVKPYWSPQVPHLSLPSD